MSQLACISCGEMTEWRCADCHIDRGYPVALCANKDCRVLHGERKHQYGGCTREASPLSSDLATTSQISEPDSETVKTPPNRIEQLESIVRDFQRMFREADPKTELGALVRRSRELQP